MDGVVGGVGTPTAAAETEERQVVNDGWVQHFGYLVWSCKVCGAIVDEGDRELHDKWHEPGPVDAVSDAWVDVPDEAFVEAEQVVIQLREAIRRTEQPFGWLNRPKRVWNPSRQEWVVVP